MPGGQSEHVGGGIQASEKRKKKREEKTRKKEKETPGARQTATRQTEMEVAGNAGHI